MPFGQHVVFRKKGWIHCHSTTGLQGYGTYEIAHKGCLFLKEDVGVLC